MTSRDLSLMNNMQIRKQNRMPGFDYASTAWYYVTVCPKSKKEWFGTISQEHIHINGNGIILRNQWLWLALQYPYVNVYDFVIMPDHFHGILSISSPHQMTGHDLSLQNSLKIKTLSQLIGAFKTTSSKLIHQSGCENFIWQRSYYDHIVRNQVDYMRIRKYIFENPLHWYLDNRNLAFKMI